MIKLILSLALIASANTKSNSKINSDTLKAGLVKPAVTDPLINEVVTYKPITDHHFNLEAPQECGTGNTIDPTAREITCQFHKSGEHQVRLSVCDNAKKYCKQEIIKVAVRKQKSGTPRIKTAPIAETLRMQKETKKILMSAFKSMSPDEAKQAVSTKKAALVMVSTDWCPPCNMAKEFLLPTDEFKKATKDMLLVYVDGDSPASDAWKPFLKSRFYPTFIILNKNLESVALFSDGDVATNTKKIGLALTSLNDPYTRLKNRINNRIAGSTTQKLKDFFTSQTSIDADQKRLLDYLDARAQHEEKINYMEGFSSQKYKNEILITQQQSYVFGKKEPDLSTEDFNKKKKLLTRTVLDIPVKGNEFYSYALESFCDSTQDEKTKTPTKTCLNYFNKYNAHLEGEKNKTWKSLTPAGKILAQANFLNERASLLKMLNRTDEANKTAQACFKEFNKLYAYSPLKEKSRSVRLQQLYCLNHSKEPSKETFKLLTSLVKDYPFEETFQRKLASYHLKKKNYKKAASYNTSALKYSYGAMWAYNMSAKAKILKGLKKNNEALSTLEEALQEFVLEKEGRSSRTIKMLRSQYETLKAELKNGKI